MPDTDFILVDHQASLRRLTATMQRVGARCSAAEFVRAVSNAYHSVQAREYARDMPRFFRTSGSYDVFKGALLAARARLGPLPRILDVGCGTGYDLEVLGELWPPAGRTSLIGCDTSPEMLEIARANGGGSLLLLGDVTDCREHAPFDLVVTHSFLHHVPNLYPVLGEIDRVLAPGGCYVMAHEPNRRYWTNPECRAALRLIDRSERRRERLRRCLEPGRYVSKAMRILGLARDVNLEDEVNRHLRGTITHAGDLTRQEVCRLVDVHVPDLETGDFKVGADGLDWEDLRDRCLPGYEPVFLATVGYAGQHNPADLRPRFRALNDRLAALYPLDGSVFCASWRKPGLR